MGCKAKVKQLCFRNYDLKLRILTMKHLWLYLYLNEHRNETREYKQMFSETVTSFCEIVA